MTSDFSAKKLFFSGGTEYFRPLPILSYNINAYINATPASFHLVNVAIHLMNGLLIYALAAEVLREELRKDVYSLVAALIFVLHPLNTEVVMWISARQDLICCFFFLISLILFFRLKNKLNLLTLGYFFVAYLFALLSKEVALILLVIVPLYLILEYRFTNLKGTAAIISTLSAAGIIYLFMRSGKKAVADTGLTKVLATVVSTGKDQPSYLDGIAAFGFYLQKLIWPFPLNFAIIKFNHHIALAVLVFSLLVAGVLFLRKRLFRLPLLIIFLAIILPVAAYLSKMPWTPYAERYLYLPMVGFSLLVALMCREAKRMSYLVPIVLALLLAVPTIYRVNLWADPVAFWNDVVIKSPTFHRGYLGRAAALIDTHDYAAAEADLQQALSMGYNYASVWQNLGKIYAARHDHKKYESAMEKSATLSAQATGIYIQLADHSLRNYRDSNVRTGYAKAIGYYLKAVERDPAYALAYYNAGKLYWVLGEREKSARYLALFLDKAKTDPMRPYAQKILAKVTSTSNK